MSDNDNNTATPSKPITGWTDRERLVYIFGLMEASAGKLNYDEAPRPPGRTLVACQQMIKRLHNSLKDELAAMKAGQPIEDVVKTPKTAKTPGKRKAKAKDAGDDGSPKKRGRKGKKGGEEDKAGEIKTEAGEEDGGLGFEV